MRLAIPLLILGAALGPGPSLAEDTTTMSNSGLAPGGGFLFNTTLSLNRPLTTVDPIARAAEELDYRRDLYQRSVGECALLLETVAAQCEITGVNVSTQINSNPGQPDYLYASSTINMQVELK